jgi:hypothetical protein
MSNVLMLNIAFNLSSAIIFSTNILLIIFIIIFPNIKGIIHFFFLQKTLSLYNPAYLIISKRMRRGMIILKSIIIIGFSFLIFYPGIKPMTARNTPALYGVYQTNTFIVSQDTSHTFMANYWKRIIIDSRTTYINIG